MFLSLFISCSSPSFEDEISITNEKELKSYLISKNKNFIFVDNIQQNELAGKPLPPPTPIYLNSVEELDAFLSEMAVMRNELESEDLNHLTYYYSEGGGEESEYYIKKQFSMSPHISMNVGFNVNNCKATNLNSWISGITIGFSYHHMGGTKSTANNTIYFRADGVFNYNIVFEGIGTIFSENISHSGTHSCN